MPGMARARAGRDDRGRLCVFGRALVRGVERRRRIVVPGDDEALAGETVRELNRRFALGDLSWFAQGREGARPPPRVLMLADWSARWLEQLEGQVTAHTFKDYRSHVRDILRRFGERRLDRITPGDVLILRDACVREGLRDRTIRNRLGVLRMLYRDARFAGYVDSSPLDVPLPRRRTKRQRRELRSKRVTFRPLEAAELRRLAAVLLDPQNDGERRYFPLTEFLLLTGLRYGEAAGLRWSDVSHVAGRIEIRRAVSSIGPLDPDAPTKTGAEWSVPLKAPLEALLHRQRDASSDSPASEWVFPNSDGRPINHANWIKRGWAKALERAEVSPREGDAQKALRRTYITSALVCGRNPKLVAGELGHTTSRMVVEVYDSFLDPANWPDDLERRRLAAFYGWRDAAPLQHPNVHAVRKRKGPTRQHRVGPRRSGAPDKTRTCDLQVRNLTLYPTELRALGRLNLANREGGGESGIRTHGTLSGTRALQARAFSRSAISPESSRAQHKLSCRTS